MKVLLVDDSVTMRRIERKILGDLPGLEFEEACDGEEALETATRPPVPDLVLLDLIMPKLDGYGVLEGLRRNPATRHVPVIFLTAIDAAEDQQRGLGLGAVDYVTKPIRPAILRARVQTHLELKRAHDWLQDQNGFLEREVARRMRENEIIKDAALHALALLAETRDTETGNHVYRTQAYVEALARQLARRSGFATLLPASRINQIVRASALHDLGKVGIPDHILRKPGRLTPDEFEMMKTHAALGADAIAKAIQKVSVTGVERLRIGSAESMPLSFLEDARQIAQGHHEKWAGGGYPLGLAGNAIPLPARLMALADVYDALIAGRVYRPALPREEVNGIILDGRGRHFDPEMVDAFTEIQDEFWDIANRYASPEE